MSHICFNFLYIHHFLLSLISVKIPNVAIHIFATNIILAIASHLSTCIVLSSNVDV